MSQMRPRQVNADGTVTIFCRTCEQPVCKMMYRGFSTIDQCENCATGRVSPMQFDPDAIGADILSLYNDSEQRSPAEKERIGLVGYMFHALGFGKKKAVVLTGSQEVAKRKKRKSLFASLDDDTTEDKNDGK